MSELWQKSAVEIAALVRGGKVSARDVTESALARLLAANPALNAVVETTADDARRAADALDARIACGEDVGIMAGVPVTVKVNTDQKGHASTNGLRLQKDLIAETDNPVVSNLKKADAIIIGRTNTPAFSLRWFTRNSLHGHTRNPLNPAITCGGSSGGAAAATAAGIGAIGHGTDIAGSIRYPAYACGIHGLRPTFGRIPAVNFSGPDRHIGAQIMAVSGPLARSIADVRLGFEAMAASDPRDPWQVPAPLRMPMGEKRAALAVAPSGMTVAPRVADTVRKAAARLEAAGWRVEEVECPDLRDAARHQAVLWLAEFRRNGPTLIEKECDPDALFVYQQMTRRSPAPDVYQLMETLQRRVALSREWTLFLEKYGILICPVSAELPFPDLLDIASPEAFDRVMEAQLLQIAIPFLGLPGLTVTTTHDADNTPCGIQLIAPRFHEEALLQAGAAIEAGTSAHARPWMG